MASGLHDLATILALLLALSRHVLTIACCSQCSVRSRGHCRPLHQRDKGCNSCSCNTWQMSEANLLTFLGRPRALDRWIDFPTWLSLKQYWLDMWTCRSNIPNSGASLRGTSLRCTWTFRASVNSINFCWASGLEFLSSASAATTGYMFFSYIGLSFSFQVVPETN